MDLTLLAPTIAAVAADRDVEFVINLRAGLSSIPMEGEDAARRDTLVEVLAGVEAGFENPNRAPHPCSTNSHCPALMFALVKEPSLPPTTPFARDPNAWMTRHGEVIPIRELEDQHLKSIIAWFDRDITRLPKSGMVARTFRYRAALYLVNAGARDADVAHLLREDCDMVEVWRAMFPPLPAAVAEAARREFTVPESLRPLLPGTVEPPSAGTRRG